MKTKRQKIALAVCILLIIGTIVFLLLLAFLPGKTKEKTKWSDWVTTVAASCEEDGVQIRMSLSDPSVFETRAIPATGHEWSEWERTVEPTCLVAGYETRTCAHNPDSHIDYRPIEALGHDWGEWETVLEPTCTTDGFEKRVCANDPETHADYRKLNALGHDWIEKYVVTTAPTCTEDGEETLFCRNCNEHTKTKKVAAYGHDWSDWIVTTAPTESEEGEETRYCRNDIAHTETRTLPPVGSEGLAYTPLSENSYSVRRLDKDVSGTVYIPATYNGLPVTEIAGSAFHACNDIERIVLLGDNLTNINSSAFAVCENLKTVEFRGNGLKSIESSAFYKCGNLENIEFPEGVETIGSNIFRNCSNLTSVSFPASLVSLGENVFYGCSSLENITVAEDNPVYRSENGCLIERATNTLLMGTVNAVIPETVTKISGSVFYWFEIESISIPASVVEIASGALRNEHLTSIEVQEGNTAYQMVSGCLIEIETQKVLVALNGATIPETVKQIGGTAFSYCKDATIEIPAGIEAVGSRAFSNLTEEQTIVIKGFASEEEADAAWGANWRDGCNATIVYEKD